MTQRPQLGSPVRRHRLGRGSAVDQIAQATRRGWKISRSARRLSVSRPKASTWLTYWEMFPGNTATKNPPTIHPIRFERTAANAAPRPISTAPDSNTMVSTSPGTHPGTWARNEVRAHERWAIPAVTKRAANAKRAIVRGRLIRSVPSSLAPCRWRRMRWVGGCSWSSLRLWEVVWAVRYPICSTAKQWSSSPTHHGNQPHRLRRWVPVTGASGGRR